ncbi:MAG TPA: glycosyltransferase family 4 protein [Chthoniobacteraceae bacterium]|jgi:glycosyltransferase involved in cell wall biosynthesis|nr:glycosyltransferase family 4 protein [Chthoniobacteraceae bacterium]
MNLVILGRRWEHHTPAGGYDRLAQYLDGDLVSPRPIRGAIPGVARSLFRRFNRVDKYLVDYRLEDLVAELRIARMAMRGGADLVHCLYGDEQLDLLLRWRRRLRCPLMASFHLPPSRIRDRFEVFHKRHLRGLDAAAVVSRSQIENFQEWFGERVFYIPHGINTGAFTPAEHREPGNGTLKLLTVGECMRDWEVLHRVIDACADRSLEVEFDVVLPEWRRSHLTGCRNTRLHTGISEEALLGLYRGADALLLPVVEATANNAVLESLACGTPVISTHVGGIPDYVDESCGWMLPPGDSDAMADLISHLCENHHLAAEKREAARARSLDFSWPVIAEAFHRLYSSLLAGKRPERAVYNPGGRFQTFALPVRE